MLSVNRLTFLITNNDIKSQPSLIVQQTNRNNTTLMKVICKGFLGANSKVRFVWYVRRIVLDPFLARYNDHRSPRVPILETYPMVLY